MRCALCVCTCALNPGAYGRTGRAHARPLFLLERVKERHFLRSLTLLAVAHFSSFHARRLAAAGGGPAARPPRPTTRASYTRTILRTGRQGSHTPPHPPRPPRAARIPAPTRFCLPSASPPRLHALARPARPHPPTHPAVWLVGVPPAGPGQVQRRLAGAGVRHPGLLARAGAPPVAAPGRGRVRGAGGREIGRAHV